MRISSQSRAMRGQIIAALECAGPRWISYEPILGPLAPAEWPAIEWWILGGESGPGHRVMPIEWLMDAVDSARSIGQRVFVKQDAGSRSGRQGRLPDTGWALKEWPRPALDADLAGIVSPVWLDEHGHRRPTRPCPRCGCDVLIHRWDMPTMRTHGWRPYGEAFNWCGHAVEVVLVPELDGRCREIPIVGETQ